MSITPETVEHVAKLARLELTADEVSRFTQDLGNILKLVEELNGVDLSDIAVEMDTHTPVVTRPDEGVREFTRDALLRNAPQEEDGFFRVPKILGDSTD